MSLRIVTPIMFLSIAVFAPGEIFRGADLCGSVATDEGHADSRSNFHKAMLESYEASLVKGPAT